MKLFGKKHKDYIPHIVLIVILLWFLGDWAVEISKIGIYMLSWTKLSLLCTAMGMKTVHKLREKMDEQT